MLESAGLRDLIVRTSKIDMRQEVRGILRRFGLGGLLQSFGRMLVLYTRNPEYRAFLRETRESGVAPPDVTDYLGYGLYIGRKP